MRLCDVVGLLLREAGAAGKDDASGAGGPLGGTPSVFGRVGTSMREGGGPLTLVRWRDSSRREDADM